MFSGPLVLLLAATRTSGILHRPGIDLPYAIYGNGKPVVLISGGPGFSSDYEQGIRKGCKTAGLEWIFLEQRGTPRARLDKGTEKDFAMSQYVDDFDALRKQLHLKTWNIIGHSWGSMVAHAYVAVHPENVSSVVFLGDVGPDTSILGAAGDNIDRALTPEEIADEAKYGGNAVTGPADDDAALKLFMVQLPAYFYSRKIADESRQMFSPGCLVGNTENVVLPALMKENWDVRGALAGYKGPALALQGRQDICGETPPWEDKLAMPQTQVVFVERAGHLPWLEQPGAFFKALDAFLSRNAK
jgi:proline iminopeptidase